MALLTLEALREAVSEVIAEHKRTGEPLVVWRDGKVVKIPADQIGVRETQANYSKKKKNGYKRNLSCPYPNNLDLYEIIERSAQDE
jgi:hypothetical protein